MKYIHYLLFLLYIPILFGQRPKPYRFYIPANVTRIDAASMGMGTCNPSERNNEISIFSNPSLIEFNNSSIYLEGHYRFNTIKNLYQDFNWDKNTALPSVVVINSPLGLKNISLGYENKINLKSESHSEIYKYDFKHTYNIHSFFIGSSKKLTEKLNGGLTIGLNYLNHSVETNGDNRDGHGFGVNIILGSMFKPIQNFELSMVLYLSTNINYQFGEQESILLDRNVDLPGYNQGNTDDMYMIVEPLNLFTKFPMRINFCVHYWPLDELDLSAQIEYQKYSTVTNEFNDQYQVYTGIGLTPLKNLNLYFGFFTEYDPAKYLDDYYDLLFISSGIAINLNKHLSISAAFVDNKIFKNQFHQKHALLGFLIRL